MFLDLYNIKYIISIIITALVIKILDDYIDLDQTGFSSIVSNMKEGILPYTLIFFSLACLMNREITVSLFVSAYIIGMLKDFRRSLSFKLKGYHESFIIIIVFGCLIGFFEMLSSIIVILAIQFLDDIIDIRKDRYFNNKNIAIRIGIVEGLLGSLILVLISFRLDYFKTLVCIVVFSIFEILDYFMLSEEKEWI